MLHPAKKGMINQMPFAAIVFIFFLRDDFLSNFLTNISPRKTSLPAEKRKR
jgi:hypothetical protein